MIRQQRPLPQALPHRARRVRVPAQAKVLVLVLVPALVRSMARGRAQQLATVLGTAAQRRQPVSALVVARWPCRLLMCLRQGHAPQATRASRRLGFRGARLARQTRPNQPSAQRVMVLVLVPVLLGKSARWGPLV